MKKVKFSPLLAQAKERQNNTANNNDPSIPPPPPPIIPPSSSTASLGFSNDLPPLPKKAANLQALEDYYHTYLQQPTPTITPQQLQQPQSFLQDDSLPFPLPIPRPITPSPEEKAEFLKAQRNLQSLQIELQSISHERHVIDVLSRDIVEKVHWNLSREAQEKLLQKENPRLVFTRGGQQPAYARDRETGGRGGDGGEKGGGDKPIPGVDYDLDKPIPVAEYIPPYLRGIKKKDLLPNSTNKIDDTLRVRNTKNSKILPSVKMGRDLPAELQSAIKISPKVFDPHSGKRMKKRKGSLKRGVGGGMVGDGLFDSRFHRTELELQQLREQLAKTNSK